MLADKIECNIIDEYRCTDIFDVCSCIFAKHQRENSCALHINGVLVAKAFASSKKTAKLAAAEYALQLLEKSCEMILMSDTPGDLDAALSRDQISR